MIFLNINPLVISQYRFRNWILDALWKESSTSLQIQPETLYLFSSKLKNFFVAQRWRKLESVETPVLSMHQSTLHLLNEIKFLDRINIHNVLLTHFNSKGEIWKFAETYNKFNQIQFLTMNKDVRNSLIEAGIAGSRIRCIFGAVNHQDFYPINEVPPLEYILIPGDCKARKNPEKVLQLIVTNPDLHFVFEETNWKVFLHQRNVLPSNVSYWDRKQGTIGELYGKALALCTLSSLEAGPIPVLQSLASGTPVLSTKVGFVPEIMKEGYGCLVEQDEDINLISDKLQQVVKLKNQTRGVDLLDGRYSWEEFGKKLFDFGGE